MFMFSILGSILLSIILLPFLGIMAIPTAIGIIIWKAIFVYME